MSKKWHSGPPPSVGWWPASVTRWGACIRWWDGAQWGTVCFRETPIREIAKRLRRKHPSDGEKIEWANRPKNWPARSRT